MLKRLKNNLLKRGWLKLDPQEYWDRRYASGGDSGEGSKGELAKFKADTINSFVAKHQLIKIAELGCGDGIQLELADYPKYTGYDISKTAIMQCQKKFSNDPDKKFVIMDRNLDWLKTGERYDLVLSLDVLYHIIDLTSFEAYLKHLFSLSNRFIIIYAPDQLPDKNSAPHVFYRPFTGYIEKEFSAWKLLDHIKNQYSNSNSTIKSNSDFFIYQRTV